MTLLVIDFDHVPTIKHECLPMESASNLMKRVVDFHHGLSYHYCTSRQTLTERHVILALGKNAGVFSSLGTSMTLSVPMKASQQGEFSAQFKTDFSTFYNQSMWNFLTRVLPLSCDGN